MIDTGQKIGESLARYVCVCLIGFAQNVRMVVSTTFWRFISIANNFLRFAVCLLTRSSSVEALY